MEALCSCYWGKKVSKYDNPKHLAKKHDKNLKGKQQKLARKQKARNSRYKYRIEKLLPKYANGLGIHGKIFYINLVISWSAIASRS